MANLLIHKLPPTVCVFAQLQTTYNTREINVSSCQEMTWIAQAHPVVLKVLLFCNFAEPLKTFASCAPSRGTAQLAQLVVWDSQPGRCMQLPWVVAQPKCGKRRIAVIPCSHFVVPHNTWTESGKTKCGIRVFKVFQVFCLDPIILLSASVGLDHLGIQRVRLLGPSQDESSKDHGVSFWSLDNHTYWIFHNISMSINHWCRSLQCRWIHRWAAWNGNKMIKYCSSETLWSQSLTSGCSSVRVHHLHWAFRPASRDMSGTIRHPWTQPWGPLPSPQSWPFSKGPSSASAVYC